MTHIDRHNSKVLNRKKARKNKMTSNQKLCFNCGTEIAPLIEEYETKFKTSMTKKEYIQMKEKESEIPNPFCTMCIAAILTSIDQTPHLLFVKAATRFKPTSTSNQGIQKLSYSASSTVTSQ